MTSQNSSRVVCKGCGRQKEQTDFTCPHCGYTQWEYIILSIVLGVIGLGIAFVTSEIIRIIAGGVGILFSLVAVYEIIVAIRAPKTYEVYQAAKLLESLELGRTSSAPKEPRNSDQPNSGTSQPSSSRMGRIQSELLRFLTSEKTKNYELVNNAYWSLSDMVLVITKTGMHRDWGQVSVTDLVVDAIADLYRQKKIVLNPTYDHTKDLETNIRFIRELKTETDPLFRASGGYADQVFQNLLDKYTDDLR